MTSEAAGVTSRAGGPGYEVWGEDMFSAIAGSQTHNERLEAPLMAC